MIKQEIDDLNRDLQKMKTLYSDFNQFTNGNPVEFLLHSRKLYDDIITLIEKPVNETLEIKTEDYPREIEARRAQEDRVQRYDEIFAMKDSIIKKLLLQNKEDVQKTKEKLERSTKEEIQEWEKLTDKFATQLQKYQLVCSYCLVTLDD